MKLNKAYRAVFVALAVLSLVALIWAQTPKPTQPAEKTKVDQHWKIVPDVAPVDLQRQLKILNEQGIVVTQSEIVLVGDKFTIMTADGADDEEEAGR